MSQPPSGPVTDAQSPAALVACPSTPNCVRSGETGQKTVAALAVPASVSTDGEALSRLIAVLEADGAKIMKTTERYVWATYRSTVLRFVDDIEFLLNDDATAFDVRSASRIGRSDFGVNRKRVERLRVAWVDSIAG